MYTKFTILLTAMIFHRFSNWFPTLLEPRQGNVLVSCYVVKHCLLPCTQIETVDTRN